MFRATDDDKRAHRPPSPHIAKTQISNDIKHEICNITRQGDRCFEGILSVGRYLPSALPWALSVGPSLSPSHHNPSTRRCTLDLLKFIPGPPWALVQAAARPPNKYLEPNLKLKTSKISIRVSRACSGLGVLSVGCACRPKSLFFSRRLPRPRVAPKGPGPTQNAAFADDFTLHCPNPNLVWLHWGRPQGICRQQLLQCITTHAFGRDGRRHFLLRSDDGRTWVAVAESLQRRPRRHHRRRVADVSGDATVISCDSPLPDATIPVSDAHVSDCIVKAGGSVPLSEPPVTLDVSGTVETDSDGDPDSTKTWDVSGDLKMKCEGDALMTSLRTIPSLLPSSTQRMSRWLTIQVNSIRG